MTTKRWAPLLLFTVATLVARGAGANLPGNRELRLVATANGREFDRFEVENGSIAVSGPDGEKHLLTGRVTWRLEGDLRRNAHLLRLAPKCTIEPEPFYARDPGREPSLVATVAAVDPVDASGWKQNHFRDAIVVVVWLLNGEVVNVAPFAVQEDNGMLGRFFGVATIRLDRHTRNGVPALLLLTRLGFLVPRPRFRLPAANEALIAMHLEPPDKFRLALGKLKPVDVGGEGGVTLLHFAANGGFSQAIDDLLRSGAQATPARADIASPLAWAIRAGRETCVVQLLAADALKSAAYGQISALVDLALKSAQPAIASMLLDVSDGWKSAPDTCQRTAEIAALHSRADILEKLVDRGADRALARVNPSLLTAAATQHDLPTLRLLLRHRVQPKFDDPDWTPLHAAAAAGELEMLNLLLDAGAPVDAPDGNGVTPLMVAARLGHVDIVDALLAHGADRHLVDKLQMTAGQHAVAGPNAAVLPRLFDRMDDLAATDKFGSTPLELALQIRARQAAQILTKLGARLRVGCAPFEQAIEGAIALDLVEILADAVEDGWDPTSLLAGAWPASRLAGHFEAKETLAWLQARDAMVDGPVLTPAAEVDSPATIETFAFIRDPRPASRDATATQIEVIGIVDTEGRFLFPRTFGGGGIDLHAAVLEGSRHLELDPARKDGSAVPVAAQFHLFFPAPTNAVFEVDEVDVPPRVNQAATLAGSRTIPTPERVPVFPDSYSYSALYPSAYSFAPPVTPAGDLTRGIRPTPRQTGETFVRFVVERDGTTGAVEVLANSNPDLTRRALAAVRNTHFEPALRDGQPVRVHFAQKFHVPPKGRKP